MWVKNMKRKNIKVLLIEDESSSVGLYQKIFKMAVKTSFEVSWADSLAKALQYEKAGVFDLILTDLSLPDSRGFDTFIKVKSLSQDAPIIILTGSGDDDLAIRAVSEGAQDYITKAQLECKMITK